MKLFIELLLMRGKFYKIFEQYVKMQVSMRVLEQISTLIKKFGRSSLFVLFNPKNTTLLDPS
jgi:hypothetical protein